MTERRLVIVADAASVPSSAQGTTILVLDPTWTPVASDPPEVVAARQVLGRVVERVDLFDGALERVDAWAAASGIADTFTVEGVTYWFRLRETMWRWVHERLLWRLAVQDLERDGAIVTVRMLADEPALADVIRARWPEAETPGSPASPVAAAQPQAVPSPPQGSTIARVGRLFGRGRSEPAQRDRAPAATGGTAGTVGTAGTGTAERERREAILAERAVRIANDERARVIVLTNPGTHQRVGTADDGARVDPLFGSVIPGLESRGFAVALLATGIDQRRDDDWAIVAADDRLLPQFLLRTRWSAAGDDDRAARAVASILAAIDAATTTPLLLDDLDLTGPFLDAMRTAATQIVRTDVQMLARIERLVAELRPSAIVLAQEGIRTPWLVAGHAAGIPVVAVQHGILYAGHAGYPNRRHPALRLPARTCVYGPFERDVLLDLAYEPDEVVVTGSPRLDLDAARAGPDDASNAAAERDAVRRELGVAAGDRLVLVSTVNLRFVQRSHFVHMLEAILGSSLPGVHVVFKLHPGERDEGPYRQLLLGMARASGYPAPPISVVKDIDLYRLLRAADAHLGLLSTVLTEAVVTGTPNLIAMTDGHVDLLGYVAAGVARPVRTPSELLQALDQPDAGDPARRQAFLDRHFLRGDASARIIDTVAASIASSTAEHVS